MGAGKRAAARSLRVRGPVTERRAVGSERRDPDPDPRSLAVEERGNGRRGRRSRGALHGRAAAGDAGLGTSSRTREPPGTCGARSSEYIYGGDGHHAALSTTRGGRRRRTRGPRRSCAAPPVPPRSVMDPRDDGAPLRSDARDVRGTPRPPSHRCEWGGHLQGGGSVSRSTGPRDHVSADLRATPPRSRALLPRRGIPRGRPDVPRPLRGPAKGPRPTPGGAVSPS